MFCTKCGQQLSDDMAFCPNCGNKIANNVPPQAAPPPEANSVPYQAAPPSAANSTPYQAAPPQMAKKPSKAKVIIIAAAVIAVLLFIVPSLLSRGGTPEQTLAGTWIASFAGGEGQCRLHFDDSGDSGAALLARFDQAGNCIGYFEAIYLGEVTLTKENEGDRVISGIITIENVSNKDNPDHDYELPSMTVQYDFDTKTKELTLGSSSLSDYFNEVADYLTFEHMDSDEYYPSTGERYYDWSLFY